MGKLIVTEFITVDGVVEDPGGAEKDRFDRGGWAFEFARGDDGDRFKLDELMGADALLLGRRTYEGFAAAWPGREDEAGFADKFNNMRKYVVSTTLSNPEWTNSQVLGPDLRAEIARIKGEHDGHLLVNGSVTLVHALAAEGLVDQWNLMMFPVVLGAGRRLFPADGPSTKLELQSASTVGEGVQILVYTPSP